MTERKPTYFERLQQEAEGALTVSPDAVVPLARYNELLARLVKTSRGLRHTQESLLRWKGRAKRRQQAMAEMARELKALRALDHPAAAGIPQTSHYGVVPAQPSDDHLFAALMRMHDDVVVGCQPEISDRDGALLALAAGRLRHLAEGSPGVTVAASRGAVLDLALPPSDDFNHARTVRHLLLDLLVELVVEGSNFDSKRPYGYSGWDWHLQQALITGGLASNEEQAVELLRSAILSLGVQQ